VTGITRDRIVTGILRPYADRPGAALSLLRMLRVLVRHAIEIDWLKHDPTLAIKRPKIQQVRSWTDDEIAAFERRWPIGTKQRTAFALMLYTGQRRSDVHRMTWADISGDTIHVVQQKTRTKLAIPLHTDLRVVLAAAKREHVTIVNSQWARPFTVGGFGGWFRAVIAAAGLPLDCQPHGLRKAAGRRLAEAGCSTKEVMAILGHQSLAEAERYTRDADQAELGQAAITKLEARKANGSAQTGNSGLGKTAKNGDRS
jgi:enterobacteria phage integrase